MSESNGIELSKQLAALLGEQQRGDDRLMDALVTARAGKACDPKLAGNGARWAYQIAPIVMLLLALFTGLAAYTTISKSDLIQRIDTMDMAYRERLTAVLERVGTLNGASEARVHEHESTESHVGTASRLSGIDANAKEIETQFRGLREVVDLKTAALDRGIDRNRERIVEMEQIIQRNLEASIGERARLDERVKALERRATEERNVGAKM